MAATRRRRVLLDPGHPVFRTHFPGMPRVPGSLIVQGFLDMLAEEGLSSGDLLVRRFRFRRFLAPGVCDYEIERLDAARFCCRVWDGTSLVCEGMVECLKP